MEKKNNNVIIIILVLIIGICIGVLVGRSTAPQSKCLELKSETSSELDEEKIDNKEEEEVPEEEKEEILEHTACGICDLEGAICCGAGPGVTYDDLHINLNEQGLDEIDINNFKTDIFDLHNDDYKYDVQVIFKNGVQKVEVNGKEIFKTSNIINDVFLLDNGMIGIEYYDDEDQARLVKRDYYNTKLNKLDTIEGIKRDVDIFAKSYEHISLDFVCISGKYRERKTLYTTITTNSIETKLIKTEKEEGCAGMA